VASDLHVRREYIFAQGGRDFEEVFGKFSQYRMNMLLAESQDHEGVPS
jgi:hypothetical protein